MSYSNNVQANRNRYAKAHHIAAWCWHNGFAADMIAVATLGEWNRISRLAVSRVSSDQTRTLVRSLLTVKEAWAMAYPDHPDARRIPAAPKQPREASA